MNAYPFCRDHDAAPCIAVSLDAPALCLLCEQPAVRASYMSPDAARALVTAAAAWRMDPRDVAAFPDVLVHDPGRCPLVCPTCYPFPRYDNIDPDSPSAPAVTASMFEDYPDDTPPAEPLELEDETRGQQLALVEWCGLEHQTFRR
jgi:hypothetical protein